LKRAPRNSGPGLLCFWPFISNDGQTGKSR
jgi:hypothetical protein